MLNSIVHNDIITRALHTFWQAFVAVFAAGALGVLSPLLSTHNLSDAESALAALVIAAVAAGLSALKSFILPLLVAQHTTKIPTQLK